MVPATERGEEKKECVCTLVKHSFFYVLSEFQYPFNGENNEI